jgi:predicted TIM-barrel fold metal-dependent hydrolase
MATADQIDTDSLPGLDHRINDLDSHEMIPTHMWEDEFGVKPEAVLGPLLQPGSFFVEEGVLVCRDLAADDTPVTSSNVWKLKGPRAPGSTDMRRRLAVMDEMGVHRQLLFPGFGGVGLALMTVPADFVRLVWGVRVPDSFDMHTAGQRMCRIHNDWVLRQADVVGIDRIRPLAIISTYDIAEAVAEAERMLAGGAPGLVLPSSVPPGGRSPADRALDPLWRLAVEADVPVTLHIGGDYDFMKTWAWGAIEEFATPADRGSHEFPGFDPYTGSSFHYCSENFLQAMTLGGVFERHPDLRFGVIETGACWVGPLAERMDMWSEQFPSRAARTMNMRPSEYLARNVRVSPFYFEPVDRYFDRWPQLSTVYSYASDYPHIEGGQHQKMRFHEALAPLGEDVLEKFFVTNGAYLLPELGAPTK